MAKVKVKLDLAAIKKWLLEHGEKLAFGCTVLIFLMFTWSAIRRDVLEPSKQPTQLQQQANDVGSHVTKSPWNDETAKTAAIEIIRYDERAQREQIAAAAFPTPVPFNPPLADPKIKRASPELLPIEELKVASGFGTFSLKGDAAAAGPGNRGGGTKLKGLPWVAITGLVPNQKQAREFARVFDRALGGNREKDTVRYVGFKIERAEVNDQEPGKLDWKPLARAPFADQFEPGLPEVVQPDFVDSMLTMPLRPLVGADWGDAVTHPKIPLAVQSKVQVQTPPPPADNGPKEAEPKEAVDAFQQASHAGPDQTIKPTPATTSSTQPDEAELGHRLFRAFDFTVEPNKKYRYRVFVRLENPNFALSRQYLKDPETAKQKYLDTNSTEPSGAISVPDGYQVLAGVVKPLKLGEPAAKLMLIAIDKENGMEPAYEYDVGRGSVANTTVKELNVLNRQTKRVEEMTDVKFRSDMVVLDIRGGKVVSGKSKLTAPGEVLLLDRNGDLMVRSELDDQLMYEKRKPPEEPETRAKRDPIPDTPKPGKPKKVKPQR